MDLKDWLVLLGAVATFITATVVPSAIAIINAIKNGQVKQVAAAAITAEQYNRYLATRGAEPVTAQSPPMGTGDGRVDKAVTSQLANAPTSPSTVPAAQEPPATP